MKPIKLTDAQMDAALGIPGPCLDCGAPAIHVGGKYWRWEHNPECPHRELTHVEKTLLGALK